MADDNSILRSLAAEVAERAQSTANNERRRAWYALDEGSGDRPMILAEVQGLPDNELDDAITTKQCVTAEAQRYERMLRTWIYEHDVLQDDHVIEQWINVPWAVNITDYGVTVEYDQPEGDGHVTARRWTSPIKDLDTDLEQLSPRVVTVDRDQTARSLEYAREVFDGILSVRIRGSHYWTLGMTWTAIELIGLEEFMYAMYDHPDGLHRLMRFLADDHIGLTEQLEQQGLYTPNHENDYIGSGSMGYTRSLPGNEPASRSELWCLSESQETVGVSPEMFAEFVFPYQKEITDLFGRVYYGCCEPVDSRISILRQITNLARISVSPWANQEVMAHECDRDIVFSRKPNPAIVSAAWDEQILRDDLRKTLNIAAGCRLEIIMKDVHTLANQPDRLARWVAIAREEADRAAG